MLTQNLDNLLKTGKILYDNYYFNKKGIFGRTEMPGESLPKGIKRGSIKHQLFITLILSINYLKDAHKLWDSARNAYNSEYQYIFDLEELKEKDENIIADDLRTTGISPRFYKKDAHIIKTVGSSLIKEFNGNPEKIFSQVNYKGDEALKLLRSSRYKKKFPFLKGKKIGPLWIRALKNFCDLPVDLSGIPIAVDVHIARGTFTLGGLTGKYNGTIPKIRRDIEELWFKVAEKLTSRYKKDFIAPNFDETLWNLSKFGCSKRKTETKEDCPKYDDCPISDYCVNGIIEVSQESGVYINTTLKY